MGRRRLTLSAVIIASAVLPGFGLIANANTLLVPNPKQIPIPGTSPVLLRGAVDKGAAPSRDIHVVMALKYRNAATIGAIVDQGRRITESQFQDTFAPEPANVSAVLDWARSLGFVASSKGSDLIDLSGPSDLFDKALRTETDTYSTGAITYSGISRPATIPSAISGYVASVSGLTDLQSAHANQPVTQPGVLTSKMTTPGALDRLYDVPQSPSGDSSSIAILAEGDLTNVTPDLRVFESHFGLPQVPVSVVGTGSSDEAAASTYDLVSQYASATSPTSALQIYDSPSFSDFDVINTVATFRDNDESRNAILPLSGCESLADLTGFAATLDQLLESAALEGLSVFVPAGDSGSSCSAAGLPGVAFGVQYPASSEWSVAVGGTSVLDPESPSSSSNETAWTSGGGGFSTSEHSANWQTQPTASVAGQRSVPDVALTADPRAGYATVVDGNLSALGGTTAAAAAWTGLWNGIQRPNVENVGLATSWLYQQSAGLHDILLGSNGVDTARPGADEISGLGTPDVTALASSAVAAEVLEPPLTSSECSDGDSSAVRCEAFEQATTQLAYLDQIASALDGATELSEMLSEAVSDLPEQSDTLSATLSQALPAGAPTSALAQLIGATSNLAGLGATTIDPTSTQILTATAAIQSALGPALNQIPGVVTQLNSIEDEAATLTAGNLASIGDQLNAASETAGDLAGSALVSADGLEAPVRSMIDVANTQVAEVVVQTQGLPDALTTSPPGTTLGLDAATTTVGDAAMSVDDVVQSTSPTCSGTDDANCYSDGGDGAEFQTSSDGDAQAATGCSVTNPCAQASDDTSDASDTSDADGDNSTDYYTSSEPAEGGTCASQSADSKNYPQERSAKETYVGVGGINVESAKAFVGIDVSMQACGINAGRIYTPCHSAHDTFKGVCMGPAHNGYSKTVDFANGSQSVNDLLGITNQDPNRNGIPNSNGCTKATCTDNWANRATRLDFEYYPRTTANKTDMNYITQRFDYSRGFHRNSNGSYASDSSFGTIHGYGKDDSSVVKRISGTVKLGKNPAAAGTLKFTGFGQGGAPGLGSTSSMEVDGLITVGNNGGTLAFYAAKEAYSGTFQELGAADKNGNRSVLKCWQFSNFNVSANTTINFQFNAANGGFPGATKC